MATLYKNNGIYYLGVSYNGKQKAKSLGTKENVLRKNLNQRFKRLLYWSLWVSGQNALNCPFQSLPSGF